jgi:hypothetical protein
VIGDTPNLVNKVTRNNVRPNPIISNLGSRTLLIAQKISGRLQTEKQQDPADFIFIGSSRGLTQLSFSIAGMSFP